MTCIKVGGERAPFPRGDMELERLYYEAPEAAENAAKSASARDSKEA
ncbi:MAG TPA: hypothetical protein VFL45_01390 [Gammaproteobacteria bacterium]|nr:hypothetical protein [Gammaproteobacteria bacterium]